MDIIDIWILYNATDNSNFGFFTIAIDSTLHPNERNNNNDRYLCLERNIGLFIWTGIRKTLGRKKAHISLY